MAIESKGAPGLNYDLFRRKLTLEGFSRDQNGPLKLRLELLESFMEDRRMPIPVYRSSPKPEFPDTKMGHKAERAWEAEQTTNRANNDKMRLDEERMWREAQTLKAKTWSFPPGSLTIVDLSCPFVDDSAACALFNICLELFLETRGNAGRVVALDEAHKVHQSASLSTCFISNLPLTVYDWHRCSEHFHREPSPSDPPTTPSSDSGHHRNPRTYHITEAARPEQHDYCASLQLPGLVPSIEEASGGRLWP